MHGTTTRSTGTGAAGVLLVGAMIAGSIVLWVGVPLGGLFVAGRVQGATGDLAAALLAGGFTCVAGIVLTVRGLVALSALLRRIRAAHGDPDLGHGPLEAVLAASASIVLILFVGWFLLFAGSSPIPVSVNP